MNIAPARLAAFEILLKIDKEHAFSSVLLPAYEESLSEKDQALCHELVLGTLRRQMYLDRVMSVLSKEKKIDIVVRIALRLGLYQLLFLDRVPDHAAINESVELVKRAKKFSASGFVNAILRRVTREETLLEFTDDLDRLSIETSHPRWLLERWIAQFGEDEAAEIAYANNEIPTVAFRRTCNSTNAINEQLELFRPSEFVDSCLLSERITPELRDRETKGQIYFQDEASQMVARSVELKAGDKVLDLCASPGSKTTAIALQSRSISNDILIFAGDVSGPRTAFLKQNCQSQGCDAVAVLQFDAAYGLPFADAAFDTVLVDAPCSGTGTIRHNPEIRYHLTPDAFDGFASKQLAILRNASNLVKVGGMLIYSTCSLEREENEAVCAAFLSGRDDFKPLVPNVPDRFNGVDRFARTFPHRDRMDGFFIASFRRVRN